MSYQSNLHKFRSLKWNESEDLETYRQGLSTLSEGIGNLYEKNAAGQVTKDISRCQFMLGLPDPYQIGLADLSEETPLGTIIKRAEKLKSLRQLRSSSKTSKAAVSWDGTGFQTQSQDSEPEQDNTQTQQSRR